MRVWIVNYYSQQPAKASHLRHLMFAKYLQEAGYNVTNFSAEVYDGTGNLLKETSKYVEVDYDNYHFDETVTGNDILFNYMLKDGASVTRNAIKLLGLMGFGEEITDKANEMARIFQETGKWRN